MSVLLVLCFALLHGLRVTWHVLQLTALLNLGVAACTGSQICMYLARTSGMSAIPQASMPTTAAQNDSHQSLRLVVFGRIACRRQHPKRSLCHMPCTFQRSSYPAAKPCLQVQLEHLFASCLAAPFQEDLQVLQFQLAQLLD